MSINAGFWGLTVEPNKSYSEEVEDDFEVSMAALDVKIKGDKRCCLKVTVEDKTFVLCSLIPGKVEQQQLSAKFNAGETVTFESTGETAIHLTGNYTEPAYDQDPYGIGEEEDEDESLDEGKDDALLAGLLNGDDSMEEEEEDDDDEEMSEDEEDDDGDEAPRIKELVEDEEPKSKHASASSKPAQESKPEKASVEPKANKRSLEAEATPAAKKVKSDKKEDIKQEKKAQKSDADTTPKKRELPNGLIIEDTVQGDSSAPTAKSGKRVGMRYIGKLTNGKIFDSNTKGKPFNFVLGKGEVIKGWDLGIQGMKVGGERRLTIPAPLAYGKQKQAGIPANSTLVFDVKLLSVK